MLPLRALLKKNASRRQPLAECLLARDQRRGNDGFATMSLPLKYPQEAQTRWGNDGSPHCEQGERLGAVTLSWLARRIFDLEREVLRLGTATAISFA